MLRWSLARSWWSRGEPKLSFEEAPLSQLPENVQERHDYSQKIDVYTVLRAQKQGIRVVICLKSPLIHS